jgi:hypothetical protein
VGVVDEQRNPGSTVVNGSPADGAASPFHDAARASSSTPFAGACRIDDVEAPQPPGASRSNRRATGDPAKAVGASGLGSGHNLL